MSDAPVIEVRDAWKSYDAGRVPVLREVDLRVARGEVVALWGRSGSGKSTLLHLLGGLDVPDRGTVRTGGLDPSRRADRLRLRREVVGYVFQFHHLVPDLTLAENVLVPARAVGWSAPRARARLAELLDALGLAHRAGHRVQELSGGERQRAALARALLLAPPVLLCDEPTGALDERTGEEVFALLLGLARDAGTTIVLATHERRFAEAADRIVQVRDGRASTLPRPAA